MGPGAVQAAILVLGAVSIGLSAWAIRQDQPLVWDWAAAAQFETGGAPIFETVLDYTAPAGEAHSPAIILREDGYSILWFEGSQEAQADVDIVGVDIGTGGVSSVTPRVTRGGLGDVFEPRQLVVTLGNTVQNDVAQNAVFATVVSLGGWAMASIADVRMGPGGLTSARKLNLSPIINRSFLVKSPMISYADGSQALPVYFEMGQTYGALVRLDRRGRVRDMRRMAGSMKPIQPMIVPLDARRAVAFMRNFESGSDRLLVSRTEDGGQNWDRVRETDIPNPSAPVAALGLGGNRILMAVNDDVADSSVLSLTLSEDGGETWRALHRLEEGGGSARYPMMRVLPDGRIVLAYSVGDKRGIRAHVFNLAWALGA